MTAVLLYVAPESRPEVLELQRSLKCRSADTKLGVVLGLLPDKTDLDAVRAAFSDAVSARVLNLAVSDMPQGQAVMAGLGGELEEIARDLATHTGILDGSDLDLFLGVDAASIPDIESFEIFFDKLVFHDLDSNTEIASAILTRGDTDDE